MKSTVMCAWNLASDTDIMMVWIYTTNGVNPEKFYNLTSETDERTREVVNSLQSAYTKLQRKSRKKRKAFAEDYLRKQRKELLRLQKELKTAGERF